MVMTNLTLFWIENSSIFCRFAINYNHNVMKLNILTFALASILMIACSDSSTSENSISNNTSTLSIEGMTCEVGCAKGIEKMLNSTDGVVDASVNFEGKLATIHFDSTKISGNDIENLIEKMNQGQYDVENQSNKKSSSNSISSNSESDIEASTFSFEIPNFFSALKNIL